MIMNKRKYQECFIKTLQLDEDANLLELEYQGIKEWDSVGHLTLVTEIETVFNIELEVDDVIDFSSYQVGMTILEKYGIDFTS